MSKKIIIGIIAIIALFIVVLVAKNLLISDKVTSKENELKPLLKQELSPVKPEKTDTKVEPEMMAEKLRNLKQQQRLRARENQLSRQEFDPWLKELKDAHQQGDNIKIDQLIKKMEQHRKRLKTVEALHKKALLDARRQRQPRPKRPSRQNAQPSEQE